MIESLDGDVCFMCPDEWVINMFTISLRIAISSQMHNRCLVGRSEDSVLRQEKYIHYIDGKLLYSNEECSEGERTVFQRDMS